MRRLAQACTAAAILSVSLASLPTGWLMKPERMWIADSDGSAVVHFERSALFPVPLRWREVTVAERTGDAFCSAAGRAWYFPEPDGTGDAAFWPLTCLEAPPPPGVYRIYAEWRFCLGGLCARPERFTSDRFHVSRSGVFRSF